MIPVYKKGFTLHYTSGMTASRANSRLDDDGVLWKRLAQIDDMTLEAMYLTDPNELNRLF